MIAPGMIISISFAQAIGATAVVFVMDKKGGTMDRTWAAGVRPSEIMASQLVTQVFTVLTCPPPFIFCLIMLIIISIVIGTNSIIIIRSSGGL
jgi:ABC-type multidrug transport system permease subunit